jgi:predicted LPLAT superfamily acyltransferase
MSRWQGKSKGNKLGYSIFVFLLKKAGVRSAYMLLRVVALYFFFFSFDSNQHIYYYFRKRLQYSRWKAISSIYKNYYLLGQSLIDKVALTSGIEQNFTFEFEKMEYLEKIVEMKKGGILLSAHVGNWEIAGYTFKLLDTSVNIVMFDAEHEKIKHYLEGITGARKTKIILIKNNLSHIYEISAALENNELVCMHADRFLPGNKTMTFDFLGKPAQFPVGPFIIASSFNVPVTYVFGFKETDTHYHLYGTPPVFYEKGKEGLKKAMQHYVSEVEKKTLLYPLQWFNYYDFWAKA